MTQNFTPEYLTAYLYNELSVSQRLTVEDALRADPVLADTLREMQLGKQTIPQVMFEAPARALRNVLRYSRESRIEQHA